MTDDELRTLVEDLAGEVEDLRDELADEREAREDLEREVEDLRDERDDLEERVDDLEKQVEMTRNNLWDLEDVVTGDWSTAVFDAEHDPVADRLESLESTVGAAESLEDGEIKDPGPDATPLEQIISLPEHMAREQLDNASHRNTWRARNVVKDWADYASNTQVGLAIKNPELVRVLRALDDSSTTIDSKTGERVMRRVEELSKGAFRHIEPGDSVGKNQHMLVLDAPDELPSWKTGEVVT